MEAEIKDWLGSLSQSEIPESIPSLDHWAAGLAEGMAKRTMAYRKEAGRAILAKLGRDGREDWEPARLPNQVWAAFSARSIVRTTQGELRAALDGFRNERKSIDGLAVLLDDLGPDFGRPGTQASRLELASQERECSGPSHETKAMGSLLFGLWEKLKGVFTRAKDIRAPVIGEAEASNAVHAGAIEAVSVGVVDGIIAGKIAGLLARTETVEAAQGAIPGKRSLVDGAPCPRCIANAAVGLIPLGSTFPSGHGWPAFHLRCICSAIIEDLPEDYTPKSYPIRLPTATSPASDPKDPTLLYTASDRSRRDKDVMVWISTAKLDRAWRKDESYYVSPGGTGDNNASTVRGRYQAFEMFLKEARITDKPVEMSQVYVDEQGNVTFIDGRHRFAVLRDQGVGKIPVAVSKDTALRMADLYGVAPP